MNDNREFENIERDKNKLELEQALVCLTEIFKKRFNGPCDEIFLDVSTFNTSISGFIVSPEFEGMDDEQRVDMVWDLMKNNEPERKHINIIFPLTPEEKSELDYNF